MPSPRVFNKCHGRPQHDTYYTSVNGYVKDVFGFVVVHLVLSATRVYCKPPRHPPVSVSVRIKSTSRNELFSQPPEAVFPYLGAAVGGRVFSDQPRLPTVCAGRGLLRQLHYQGGVAESRQPAAKGVREEGKPSARRQGRTGGR